MIIERQFVEMFYKIQHHLDDIRKTLDAYQMPTTFLTFFPTHTEVAILQDASAEENEVLRIEYTPPVEEMVRTDKQRVKKVQDEHNR